MADIRQFSAESQQRIADVVRTVERSPILRPQPFVRTTSPTARELRWSRTTTSLEFPSYPDSGNAVVVEFGDYAISGSPIVSSTNTPSFTAYDPEQKVVALMSGGTLPTQGSVVQCYRHEGQWWIEGTTSAATPLRWTQMVSATTAGSWHFWQDGAGSRDTDGTIEITTGGVFAFPRFGIGTYSNSVGTAFALTTTPTTYNQKCITFTQKAFYSLHVTLSWGLPPLTSSQFNSDYREAAHDHTYDDGGTTKTTNQTTIDSPRKDSRQPVTVVTEVNGVELGRSSLQNFYTADGDPDMYATHSSYMQLDRSSSLTGIDIRFRRLYNEPTLQTAVPYVSRASVRLEQISDNL